LSARLDEALELAGEQREAFIVALRDEDSELADDVVAALREHASLVRERFLEDGPPLGLMGIDPTASSSLVGLELGAYTLRSSIGQGGMGSVWLADRTDGRFRGKVAVKLLNASLVGGHGDARFRREGEILARVRHRHIAALL